MGRPRGENTRCGGKLTEAEFVNFIKNQLRSATRKWAPNSLCKKDAHISRGVYKCACCEQEVTPTFYDEDKRKRVTNIFVDHISPVIDPHVGFTTWDSFINNLFCEKDNLQLLCGTCHKAKTQEEIEVAKLRRAKEKNNDINI